MHKVTIAGIGPGAEEYILPAALEAIHTCDVLIGGRRNLTIFRSLNKEIYEFTSNMQALLEYVIANRKTKKLCVIVSGDPGFYSLLDFFLRSLGEESIDVIPGISSFQYLFAVLKKPWKQYALESLHGREKDLKKELKEKEGVFVLTDSIHTPSKIAQDLIDWGFEQCKMIVGENLSYEEERIVIDHPQNIIQQKFSTLSVVVIEK